MSKAFDVRSWQTFIANENYYWLAIRQVFASVFELVWISIFSLFFSQSILLEPLTNLDLNYEYIKVFSFIMPTIEWQNAKCKRWDFNFSCDCSCNLNNYWRNQIQTNSTKLTDNIPVFFLDSFIIHNWLTLLEFIWFIWYTNEI